VPKPKYHARAKKQAKPRERKAKRIAGIWESCHKCMMQMVGEERCWEHNPPPNDDRPYIFVTEEIKRALSLQSAGEEPG
jgi:hypothetical protein